MRLTLVMELHSNIGYGIKQYCNILHMNSFQNIHEFKKIHKIFQYKQESRKNKR